MTALPFASFFDFASFEAFPTCRVSRRPLRVVASTLEERLPLRVRLWALRWTLVSIFKVKNELIRRQVSDEDLNEIILSSMTREYKRTNEDMCRTITMIERFQEVFEVMLVLKVKTRVD